MRRRGVTVPQPTQPGDRFQESVIASLRDLAAHVPWLDGALVEVPSLDAADMVTLRHGLGRIPRGMMVLDVERGPSATASVSIYRRGTATAERIEIRVTASIVGAKVWVW